MNYTVLSDKIMSMRSNILVALLLAVLHATAWAQEGSRLSAVQFLPHGSIFTGIRLDPLESQYSAGALLMLQSDSLKNFAYVPVNFGIHKSVFRYNRGTSAVYELGFEAASYTQFSIEDSAQTFLGNMLNADYRGGIYLAVAQGSFRARMRLFHISSHLADDYIIRHAITTRTPNTVNYEQLDICAGYARGASFYYLCPSVVISPHTIRKRWLFQGGWEFQRQLSRSYLHLIAGIDIKSYQHNNYHPNTRAGIGLRVDGISSSADFFLDFYNGHLPYSTLEANRVMWLGASVIVDLITTD